MTSLNPSGFTTEAMNQALTALLQRNADVMEKLLLQRNEVRVEGLPMPQFHGRMGESVDHYYDQVFQYLQAKNINYEDPANNTRILAMVASNLKHNAYAWYRIHKDSISDLQELMAGLTQEFMPPDLQERLRDQLYSLHQQKCPSFEDYISRFRNAIMQVKQMSELDKITYFVRDLVSPTKEEVQYRRCQTVSEAITIALEYDRAHPSYSGFRDRQPFRPHHDNRSHYRPQQQHASPRRFAPRQDFRRDNIPEPMEIDSGRVSPLRPTANRKTCAYCKKLGHSTDKCYKKKNRDAQKSARGPSNTFRRNFNGARDSVNYFEAEDEAEDLIINTLEVHEATEAEDSPTDEERPANELVRKNGLCDGKKVVIMLDSGSTVSVVRPGLSDHVTQSQLSQVTRFDGSKTEALESKRGQVILSIEGHTFPNVDVMEWQISKAHDVILGKPCFARFQPTINWRTHQLSFPIDRHPVPSNTLSSKEFAQKIKDNGFNEVYRVKISEATTETPIPPEIESLIGKYSDVFPEVLPPGLPPNRRVEFELNMKSNAVPNNRAPSRLSKTEQDALSLFVEEKLKQGWIELSDSPWVSNIFGIPKKDPTSGSQVSRAEWIRSGNSNMPIRWVIDYRYINSLTNVAKIPLPRIEELFDKMIHAKIFSVLNLAQGYHQMRVKPETRKYTAFRTHRETYQWCVAPMGLSGMPGVWSRLMRVLFGKFEFLVVYLDDICVFSPSIEDHVKHLEELFRVLRQEKLYAHKKKCHFGQLEVKFLGHTISNKDLAMDDSKTKAIAEWKPSTNQKELQSFLGLAGYYHRFISNFAQLALPLSPLVKKIHVWTWRDKQQAAFEAIKKALQIGSVLKLPDFQKGFIVTTDASGYCIGGVLSQLYGKDDHPVALYSKKLGEHEVNWPTHENELFAIKMALEKWRHYLYGRPFVLYTDNSACKWLMYHPKVSPKLARSLTFLAQFNFQLHHVKGDLNVVADALSRKPDGVSSLHFHRCDAKCKHLDHHIRRHYRGVPKITSSGLEFQGEETAAAIEPRHAQIQAGTSFTWSSMDMSPETKKLFQRGYAKDTEYMKDSDKFEKINGLLYVKSNNKIHHLCVPNDYKLRTQILEEFHDSSIAAHPGIRRTSLRIAQWYYWKQMEADVHDYVKRCQTCSTWKHSNAKKNGKLMPIPIPEACWEVVSMDFITGLPESDGCDAILVVVDKLSKRATYTAAHTTDDAAKSAHHFFNSVVRVHGMPKIIISDRDPKFTSRFWRSLAELMGIQLNMTTSRRAQADGQTERQNLILEDALRCMVAYHGKDWSSKLSTIEYAHATLVSASTGFSPFEIDTGRKERHPFGSLKETPPRSTSAPPIAEFASRFHEEKREIIQLARKQLLKAQALQKKYYDRKRSDVTFKQGDLIMIDTRRIPLKHSGKDLDDKRAKHAARRMGPFEIVRIISDNVAKVKLPHTMRGLNPTFNVDVLSHHVENPDRFETRRIPKKSKAIIDDDTGEELYIVEKLLDTTIKKKSRYWLVQWHGFPAHDATWEEEKNIKNVSYWKVLLDDFRQSRLEVKRGRM